MTSPSLLASKHENALAAQDKLLYEVVNGQRVELSPTSAYATWLASRLHGRLKSYVWEKGLGVSVAAMLFVLDAERDLRRRGEWERGAHATCCGTCYDRAQESVPRADAA